MNAHEDTVPAVDELVEITLDDPTGEEAGQVGRRACTDVGNAWRLLDTHGVDLRWVPKWDGWLRWDEAAGVWEVDDRESSRDWFHAIAEVRIPAEAKSAEVRAEEMQDDPDRKEIADRLKARAKKLWAWAEASQSSGRVTAALREARCKPGVPVAVEDLDQHDDLLVVANGTLDLLTGDIRPSERGDLTTKRSPVEHVWNATCPEWTAFVSWAMGGDQELVSYLQRAVGYSLTGDISEHVFFFCFGPLGRNGKGTFLSIVRDLLGPWAVSMPPALLFETRGGERHPTELARLRGVRAAFGDETEPGQKWDEPKLKMLSGGTTLAARGMGQDFFDVRPTWKLWLAGQAKPVASGNDEGLWSRMQVIPWTQTAKGREDRQLLGKLRAELPGILAWALEGVREWRRIGLSPPAAVVTATTEYREESDVIGEFLAECCERKGWETVAHNEVFVAYQAWAKGSGMKPKDTRWLSREIAAKGFERDTRNEGSDRRRVWKGLVLRHECQPNNREPQW